MADSIELGVTAPQVQAASGRSAPGGKKLLMKHNWLLFVAFGLLWLLLFNQLRVEWTINPQYSYGWVVPILALGLLLCRWQVLPAERGKRSDVRGQKSEASGTLSKGLLWLFIALAGFILPARLLLEATPGWRTLNILLTLSTLGLTLILVYVAVGRRMTWHFAFPICFVLVAAPWPYSFEVPIIQGLTHANASLAVEVLGIFGIPAVQHGNLIEVGTGTIGIDEACSGIRSFQSSLMISLFMGEFYRFGVLRRLALVPIGFIVAFCFNLCRNTLLTWIAAKNGTGAVADYHDQAGLTILLACSGAMWLIGWLMHLGPRGAAPAPVAHPEPFAASKSNQGESTLHSRTIAFSFQPEPRNVSRLALPLIIWLAFVELSIELWYRVHESRAADLPGWTLNWPPDEPSFREVPVPPVSREMLAFNEGHSGSWQSQNLVQWHLYYFRWLPGRFSLSSARGHNPSVCLAAAGKQLREIEGRRVPIKIGPIEFPFRHYEYTEDGRVVHVFHVLWEDHAAGTYFDFDPTLSPLRFRLRAALEGHRNLGQRSMEFFIRGIEDPKAAEAAVTAQLQKLITVVPIRAPK